VAVDKGAAQECAYQIAQGENHLKTPNLKTHKEEENLRAKVKSKGASWEEKDG